MKNLKFLQRLLEVQTRQIMNGTYFKESEYEKGLADGYGAVLVETKEEIKRLQIK